MKMKSIILTVVFLIILVFGLFNRKQVREKKQLIIDVGVFSIGTIKSISKGGYHSNGGINFYFKLDRIYSGRISDWPGKGIKKGDQFLVLYLEKDPRKSILLLDKPVKDSTDFKRYVKEFEEKRKKQNK